MVKQLKCEVCGGFDLVKVGDLFYCQHCRAKYTPESAKKLFVQIDGVAGVDSLLLRGLEYASAGDIETASTYYNRVLDIDPENPVARLFFSQQTQRERKAIRMNNIVFLILCLIPFVLLFGSCSAIEVNSLITKKTFSPGVGFVIFYLLGIVGLSFAIRWQVRNK